MKRSGYLFFFLLIVVLASGFVFTSCRHIKKTEQQDLILPIDEDADQNLSPDEQSEPEQKEDAPVQLEWESLLREKNTTYLHEKLGAQGEDEWFTVIPQEPAYFYFIAVSNKTSTEQRARTNAQDEARKLLRAYHEVMTGAPPGATAGRGIEVIEWKTINDVSPEGRQYYIACALVRVPVQGVSE